MKTSQGGPVDREQRGEGPGGCREPAQFLLKFRQKMTASVWTSLEITIGESPAQGQQLKPWVWMQLKSPTERVWKDKRDADNLKLQLL